MYVIADTKLGAALRKRSNLQTASVTGIATAHSRLAMAHDFVWHHGIVHKRFVNVACFKKRHALGLKFLLFSQLEKADMSHPQTVKSRLGFFAVLPLMPMSFATLVAFTAIGLMIYAGKFEGFMLVGAILLGSIGLYIVGKSLTTKVTITKDQLEFRHIWAKY